MVNLILITVTSNHQGKPENCSDMVSSMMARQDIRDDLHCTGQSMSQKPEVTKDPKQRKTGAPQQICKAWIVALAMKGMHIVLTFYFTKEGRGAFLSVGHSEGKQT